jgi:hypothetical protein
MILVPAKGIKGKIAEDKDCSWFMVGIKWEEEFLKDCGNSEEILKFILAIAPGHCSYIPALLLPRGL